MINWPKDSAIPPLNWLSSLDSLRSNMSCWDKLRCLSMWYCLQSISVLIFFLHLCIPKAFTFSIIIIYINNRNFTCITPWMFTEAGCIKILTYYQLISIVYQAVLKLFVINAGVVAVIAYCNCVILLHPHPYYHLLNFFTIRCWKMIS